MAPPPYQPIDPSGLKTFSIQERAHKVELDSFAGLPERGASMAEFLEALPRHLAATRLLAVADAIVAAHGAGRPVVWALGAHVIKVGTTPIVIDLMRRGLVTAVAMNGATAVHDVEVATLGATSEEVAETIQDGSFGMVEETPAVFAEACRLAVAERIGMGQAIGKLLVDLPAKHKDFSILAAAHELAVPVTVHVAFGTDTVHMHDNANGAQVGHATMFDFRLACSIVKDMAAAGPGQPGGVWCNVGSAVLLPEIFLKAVSVARNLGAQLDELVSVNLDMLRHYRPTENVIRRPVRPGRGFEIIGHHEILLPLIRVAVLERLAANTA